MRRTFCSAARVHAGRLRTSPSYLRQQVPAHDRSICAHCTVDTLAAHRLIGRARGARRQHLRAVRGLMQLDRRSLWDANHIVPVAEDGAEHALDNLCTLCVHCHLVVTAALWTHLRRQRNHTVALLG